MSETTYDPGTDPAVVKVFESVINTRKRVRMWYGDPETGRDWLEENDVVGTVARSGGPKHVPILLSNARSIGGGSILTKNVLAIMVDGRLVYKHPRYQAPRLVIDEPPARIGKVDLRKAGYVAGVWREGENVANFKSHEAAQRWIDFMLGSRRGK